MIGISVYPYKEIEAETIAYIKMAASHGVQRLFTNILSVDNLQEELAKMRRVLHVARELGLETIIDIAPAVFSELGIKNNDLRFFKELGATGLRLDSGYDGFHEAMLTFQESNLDIELNISYLNQYLETVGAYKPRRQAILGCHNFYPQKYTGLSLEHFMACSENAKKAGVRTAAFIGKKSGAHGPHRYDNGLCTLEIHRELPLVTQAKHLLALELIDDVIIANAYATEAEIKQICALDQDIITFSIVFEPDATAAEKQIILDHLHFNRGDVNAFVSRSTFVKLEVQDVVLSQRETSKTLTTGAITIGNDAFGQYKGEVNVVKQEIENIEFLKNKVAQIVPEELFLINYIKPWTKFKFSEELK